MLMAAGLAIKTGSIYYMADTTNKYGCHNRQLRTSYQTLVRAKDSAGNLVGVEMVTIRNTMSQACHYAPRKEDSKCNGCEWIEHTPMPV